MARAIHHIPVKTLQGSYDISIGSGLLRGIAAHFPARLHGRRICIVSDDRVAPLYLETVSESLRAAGFPLAAPFIVPAGEKSKTFAALESLTEHLQAGGMDRGGVVVALGGGVVGDLAGFAAAVFMRGIDFVQVPTTLMAQVDSSVGGKTGINTQVGKNIAGAFHQPAAVIADMDVLATLPAREMKAGYAEIAKIALAADADFFGWLEDNGGRVLARDPGTLLTAVAHACTLKATIVAADEKERNGRRALLNLGHTFGHALEALGGYDGRLLHGEAVAIGLRMAAEFSEARGLAPAGLAARVNRHLDALDLAQSAPFNADPAHMLEKMRQDKKAEGGKLNLVLLPQPGAAAVVRDIAGEEIQAFLESRPV